MCCGERANKPFARNIKRPSMFLSTLIVKRRDNRRANKPNMLLDAILSNAISNIKKDKTISKLNKLSHGTKDKINDSTSSTCSKYSHDAKAVNFDNDSDSQLQLPDEHRNTNMFIEDDTGSASMNTTKETSCHETQENNNDIAKYLAEVDNFFEKLNRVKIKNHNDDYPSTTLGASGAKFEQTEDKFLVDDFDEIVDNFIETGVIS